MIEGSLAVLRLVFYPASAGASEDFSTRFMYSGSTSLSVVGIKTRE